jgi:hypothetical protein
MVEDSTQKMVSGQNKIESSKSLPSGTKKYAIAVIIIAELLALGLLYYRRLSLTNSFFNIASKMRNPVSWLYYRHWERWELNIAVLTIAAIPFVLLWFLIARRRRKTRARIALANQGPEGPSVISVKKGKWMMKSVIAAIIMAGLLGLEIRWGLTHRFYLRYVRTGWLIGPVSLPNGHLPPSYDEEKYVVAEPTESELEVRKRLRRTRVTAKMNDIPLTEVLDHILTEYFGSEAPPVRIDIADESKMPRISIDFRSTSLYDLLCTIAIQKNFYISIENGTIVLSEKKFKAQQAPRNISENSENQEKPVTK